jgi:hypothetical protein
MKKLFLTILLILIALSIGAYYTYLTDKGFNNYVSSLLNHDVDSDSIPSIQEKPEQKTTTQYKKRVLKKIKPDKYHKLDSFARKAPKEYEKDVETLARYLITPAKSEIERVRVLFTWVATHINYDDVAFNSGNIRASPAENVLLTKKAVCDGYSNLLKELCVAAGLESEKIIGYAKGYGYEVGEKFKETNHAWNAIKIENEWKLFDATWANGYGTNKNGKLVSTNKFDPYWFDINPKESIFNHLPEDPKWQFLTDTVTLEKFEVMPYANGEFFKMGFDSDKVFRDAVSGDVKKLATAFALKFPVSALQLPYTLNLVKNEPVQFIIKSDYADMIMLSDGGDRNYFHKKDNVFTITHTPRSNSVIIYQSVNDLNSFSGIVEYKVTRHENIGTQ